MITITVILGLAGVGLAILFFVAVVVFVVQVYQNDPHAGLDPQHWDAHDEATAKYGKNYRNHPEYKRDYERLMEKRDEELRKQYDRRMK